MSQLERLSCGLVELKFAGDDTTERTFSGHGAVFKNRDAYDDVIEPGAFAEWLSDVKTGKQDWPAMLSQHGGWGITADDMTPVGIYTDLAEDGHGLAIEGKLSDTTRATDLHKLMKMKPRPAINGMSIGYYARKWTERSKPNEPRRRLHQVDVVEISLVTFPANRKARVTGVKSGNGFGTEREIERWLMQDAGLSRSEARTVINAGFKSLIATQDAGEGESQELTELAEACKRRAAALTV
jgi:uncharacterized protein